MIRTMMRAMALCLAGATAQAAELKYNFSVAPLLGGTAPGEIRATFLEVLAPVRLTSLGADLSQLSFGATDIDAAWTIYRSNANDDVLDAVITVDADFSFASFTETVETVRTAVDVALGTGYYLFTLRTEQALLYSNYDERQIAAELPLTTADGAFRVIEGGILNFAASDPSIISGNVRLPALTVGYDLVEDTPAVPLPAGGLLLLSGLGALALGRRIRARRT